MHVLLPLLPLLTTATALALPSAFLDDHPWIPSLLIPNSSRSPCPLLNTLSNHGFLPRSGRNITRPAFNEAMTTVLNLTPELASKTTDAMVAKLPYPRNTSLAFELDWFNAHAFTEHDASLTRADGRQRNASAVDPGLVRLFIGDAGVATGWSGRWGAALTSETIGFSRVRREWESRRVGTPRLSDAFTRFAMLEASFVVLVFGREGLVEGGGEAGRGDGIESVKGDGTGTVGKGNVTARVQKLGAPAELVRVWLEEERFPYEMGYERPREPLGVDLQAEIIEGIREARQNVLDRGIFT